MFIWNFLSNSFSTFENGLGRWCSESNLNPAVSLATQLSIRNIFTSFVNTDHLPLSLEVKGSLEWEKHQANYPAVFVVWSIFVSTVHQLIFLTCIFRRFFLFVYGVHITERAIKENVFLELLVPFFSRLINYMYSIVEAIPVTNAVRLAIYTTCRLGVPVRTKIAAYFQTTSKEN